MTNEEAIEEISVIHERLSHPEDCEQGVYSFRDGDYLEALDMAIKALEQEDMLEKIRAEIKAKIEEEEFARSVFRHEEKDDVKAEQCTGSIMAYKNVIKIIDKYKAESEGKTN